MKLYEQLSMLLFYLFIWSIPTIMLVFLEQHAVTRHDKGTTKFCHEIFNNSGSGEHWHAKLLKYLRNSKISEDIFCFCLFSF